MKKHKRNSQRGFTTLQLVITIVIALIVATFAYVGIVRARAHLRLSSSARQFAMLVERARADSVRRHANGSQRAMIHQVNETTYAVTMDFQGNGNVTTQNIRTEKGITLLMPFDLVFDWRGRIFSEAQVTFDNPTYGYRTWVGITGSGDVTMEADYFFDASLPTPPLNGGEGGSVIADPSPTPNGGSSPTPTPTPTPTPDPNASPTPTPSATATPLPTATPISTPTPTPTPYPSPTPTPTPVPCTITSSPTAITIGQNAAGTVNVSLVNFVGTGTIIAESSNSGQILVTPTSATVSGSAPKTFTIQVKKTSGSVTFSSVCGSSKTVTVTVR